MTVTTGAVSIEGRTSNLSRGGLCATLERAIPMGADVMVDIVLVFEDDVRSEALRLPARVAWSTAVDEGHQLGISFRPIDAEHSEYLGLFIKYLDQDTTRERTQRDLAVDDRFR